jgi:hypothetical protein
VVRGMEVIQKVVGRTTAYLETWRAERCQVEHDEMRLADH